MAGTEGAATRRPGRALQGPPASNPGEPRGGRLHSPLSPKAGAQSRVGEGQPREPRVRRTPEEGSCGFRGAEPGGGNLRAFSSLFSCLGLVVTPGSAQGPSSTEAGAQARGRSTPSAGPRLWPSVGGAGARPSARFPAHLLGGWSSGRCPGCVCGRWTVPQGPVSTGHSTPCGAVWCHRDIQDSPADSSQDQTNRERTRVDWARGARAARGDEVSKV